MHVLFKSVLVHVCVPRLLFAILRLLEVERRFIIRNYEIMSTLCLPLVIKVQSLALQPRYVVIDCM